MLTRAARAVLVLALLCQMGIHRVILQSAAWASMAREGRRSCAMCVKVQKDAQSQKKQDSQAPDKKLDLYFPLPGAALPLWAPLWTLVEPSETASTEPRIIEVPPPRSPLA